MVQAVVVRRGQRVLVQRGVGGTNGSYGGYGRVNGRQVRGRGHAEAREVERERGGLPLVDDVRLIEVGLGGLGIVGAVVLVAERGRGGRGRGKRGLGVQRGQEVRLLGPGRLLGVMAVSRRHLARGSKRESVLWNSEASFCTTLGLHLNQRISVHFQLSHRSTHELSTRAQRRALFFRTPRSDLCCSLSENDGVAVDNREKSGWTATDDFTRLEHVVGVVDNGVSARWEVGHRVCRLGDPRFEPCLVRVTPGQADLDHPRKDTPLPSPIISESKSPHARSR